VAFGSPAKRFTELTGTAKSWVGGNPSIYRDLARRHREGITEV
jgi:hypothetical protein